MRDHISFEELETFIYAEKLTPEIMMLGSRINAHVLSCSECASMYTSMIDLRDASQTAMREQSVEDSKISAQSQRDLIEQQMSEETLQRPDSSSYSRENVMEKYGQEMSKQSFTEYVRMYFLLVIGAHICQVSDFQAIRSHAENGRQNLEGCCFEQ